VTDAEILIECKKGLGIQADSTAFDGVLTQKLLAVKGFMTGAGVSAEMMATDLAVGVIVMGVTDLWKVEGGESKFSPAFYTLVSQLAIGGNILTVSSNPADGAANVAVDVGPVLIFNKRITGYTVSLVNYSTKISIPTTVSLDITGRILTIKPTSNLGAATKYAVVIDSATAHSGQTLGYTVISFTTG
jgi:hypothetical protein